MHIVNKSQVNNVLYASHMYIVNNNQVNNVLYTSHKHIVHYGIKSDRTN